MKCEHDNVSLDFHRHHFHHALDVIAQHDEGILVGGELKETWPVDARKIDGLLRLCLSPGKTEKKVRLDVSLERIEARIVARTILGLNQSEQALLPIGGGSLRAVRTVDCSERRGNGSNGADTSLTHISPQGDEPLSPKRC